MQYAGLTIADKPALLEAQAKGAEWVAVHWGGKAYGYAKNPNREDVCDECCYGSYSSWTAQDGDVEIELGFMPYPLLSYQDKEPFHIPTAIAQIAEMEREQKTNYFRIGDATSEVAVTTSKPRTNHDALIEKMRDVNEAAKMKAYEKYDVIVRAYYTPSGELTLDVDRATKEWSQWLLSPAEDGK